MINLIVITFTLTIQITLLFIGIWHRAVFATFLSALVGLEIIANVAIDPTLSVISGGQLFFIPIGYAVFPISLLVIYALVAMRAEFSLLKRKLSRA